MLIHGNNLEELPKLADASIDAIITDPPYELGFMGKSWDSTGIAYNTQLWRECLRVLKPGGHLLAFSGSRTYHRMAVAIEDAGFEIRDQIMWVYGSGFPKSLDVSKAIDKTNGEPNRLHKFTAWMRTTGLTAQQLNNITKTSMGGHYLTAASQPAIPTMELWAMIRPHIAEVPSWVDELVARIEAEREVIGTASVPVGHAFAGETFGGDSSNVEVDITAPATDAAKQWQGWGTALKPAHEPIVLARKPLDGTVANNVLQHGTGALNIDGCRVHRQDGDDSHAGHRTATFGTQETLSGGDGSGGWSQNDAGRWPANFIHDGSDEVLELFPDTGKSTGGRIGKKNMSTVTNVPAGQYEAGDPGYGDSGSAARFFYCAKANKRDRNEGLDHMPNVSAAEMVDRVEGSAGMNSPRAGAGRTSGAINSHPTVKPTELMRYLCRLITPPGGIILDPFTGSGSTGKAAILEGFNFIGIELDPDYIKIAEARIDYAYTQRH